MAKQPILHNRLVGIANNLKTESYTAQKIIQIYNQKFVDGKFDLKESHLRAHSQQGNSCSHCKLHPVFLVTKSMFRPNQNQSIGETRKNKMGQDFYQTHNIEDERYVFDELLQQKSREQIIKEFAKESIDY